MANFTLKTMNSALRNHGGITERGLIRGQRVYVALDSAGEKLLVLGVALKVALDLREPALQRACASKHQLKNGRKTVVKRSKTSRKAQNQLKNGVRTVQKLTSDAVAQAQR